MSSGKRQTGFTYLIALLSVAGVGIGLLAAAQLWSRAMQREKEAELVWIGNQYKEAIGLYYQRSPGAVKRYPEKLAELLEDRRHLGLQRYIRKLYADPITGNPEWGLVMAAEGGIKGIYSQSEAQAMRQREGARRYSDWRFVYLPPQGAAVAAPDMAAR